MATWTSGGTARHERVSPAMTSTDLLGEIRQARDRIKDAIS